MTALEKGLDGTAARQRAVAGNLANLETPGYKPQAVSFEDDLRRAIAQERRGDVGGRGALDRVAPTVHTDATGPVRLDGNAVDIEAEVAALGKNSVQHSALLRLLGTKLGMLKIVLRDGAR
jgi:flagellar basal-body rod protein FlgB